MSDKGMTLMGYRLTSIYAIRQQYEEVFIDEDTDLLPEQDFTIGWEWYPSDSGEFLVLISIDREASDLVLSNISVTVIAHFVVLDTSVAVPFEHFVLRDAPMMMFPFINEIVSSLTSHGADEPEHLSAIHFVTKLEEHDFKASTGFAVLKRDPGNAAALGVSPDLLVPTEGRPQRKRSSTPAKPTR